MKPRRYYSEGIVLARKNYSEADRILVVYSKKYGKLSLIAKGVRKLKSRKRGHIEVFSHVKFSAARGKSLDIVTEVETITAFKKARRDLKKVSVAYFFVETIGRLTREDEKNEELFILLLSYLAKLESSVKLRVLRERFIFDALVLVGFWPEGKPLESPDAVLESIVERKLNSFRVGKKLTN